jgi:hypothetical protein
VLEQITPVLLAHNEEENIGRTLGQLGWASDVVVVRQLQYRQYGRNRAQ